ncbi:hypothetical protein D9M73_63310 [compost metagenome]
MGVQAGAKAVNEGHCADTHACFVSLRRTGAVFMQAVLYHPQENAQGRVQRRPVTLHKVPQPLWYRQHPLAHAQAGEDVVCQVRRRLGHASGVARGAHTTAFAGEGHQKVMPAVVAAGACKAVGEDAAFEVFAKGLLHIGWRRVVVALAVKLARAGQLKPGLKVLGHRAVQQSLLGVAGVVDLGSGWRVFTRVHVRMRLRVLGSGVLQ